MNPNMIHQNILRKLICISETPILGGSKMPMRRETLKALEQRRDHVANERKQSKMLTLGASNPVNNNKDKHRTSAKITGETVGKIFSGIDGQDNVAYDRGNGSSNTDDEASSTTRNSGRSHGHHERIQAIHPQSNSQITWQDRHRPGLMSSDQLSSTPSLKM